MTIGNYTGERLKTETLSLLTRLIEAGTISVITKKGEVAQVTLPAPYIQAAVAYLSKFASGDAELFDLEKSETIKRAAAKDKARPEFGR